MTALPMDVSDHAHGSLLATNCSAPSSTAFAAMTSRTVGEALELAVRFTPTRTTALGLHVHVEGRDAALVIEERAPLGTARDVAIIALFVGIWEIGKAITGMDTARVMLRVTPSTSGKVVRPMSGTPSRLAAAPK